MARTLVAFKNPPVVETAIGVQFANLAGRTSAHPGVYWKGYLGKEWESVADAPPLIGQFEYFGEERKWAFPGLQLTMMANPVSRLQITNAAGDRMMQVQPTGFHYNWQKRAGTYPSFRTMRAEFDSLLASFCKFAADVKLGAISPNQWEITYVDRISRGELWTTAADWHEVLPGLLPAKGGLGGSVLESVGGEWHYLIEPARGRIHVSLQSGWTAPRPDGTEILQVQTTARGPVREQSGWSLADGLELGHNAIIEAFMEMTSPQAHKAWGLEEG